MAENIPTTIEFDDDIEAPSTEVLTVENDNLEALIKRGRQNEEIQKLFQKLETFRKEKEETEPDPDDPLDIKIFPFLYQKVKDFGADVGEGVIESPRAIVRGSIDTIQELLNAHDDLAEWLNDNIVDLGGGEKGEFGFRSLGELPKPDEPESVAGSVIQTVTQFFLPFAGFMKAIKVAFGGKIVTRVGAIAQAQVAGGLAMATAFDPMQRRLSNFIEDNPTFSGPITEFLQTDLDDSKALSRLKSGLEGLIVGAGAEGLIRGFVKVLTVLKNRQIVLGANKKAPPKEVPQGNIDEKFGDPKGNFIATEGDKDLATFVTGKGRIKKKITDFKMNWAAITDDKSIDSVLDTVAKLNLKPINEARRGVVTDKLRAKLARDLDLSPQELIDSPIGQAWNAEKIQAAQFVLDASLKEVKRLAKLAWNSTDEIDLFLFRKMFNIHTAIQAKYHGAAAEAGRALRTFQKFGGSRKKQIDQLQEMIMAEGGPDEIRRFAKAVSEIADDKLINTLANGSFGKRMTNMIIEAWYFALLSGPTTHVVNVLTSSARMLWSIPQRALAAQVNKLRNTPGIEVGEATLMLFGAVRGIPRAFKAAGRTLRTEEQAQIIDGAIAVSKIEGRIGKAITGENLFGKNITNPLDPRWFISKLFNGIGEYVYRMPRRLLMTEDEFFKSMALSMTVPSSAMRIAKQEGLRGKALSLRIAELERKPTEAMLEEAFALGKEFTFLTELGKSGKDFQALINKWPILKFILPFIRTPVNLTKFAGSSTPLGLLSGNIRNAIAQGGVEGDLAIAKMVMGSGLVLTFADLSLQGMVTGAGPTNLALRKTWLRTHQPFSIKMLVDIPEDNIKKGDWVSYNRTDPFGLLMGASASVAEIFGTASIEEMDEIGVAIAVALSRSIFNKTWMRGPADAIEALSNPETNFKRWARNQTGTFLIPTLSKQIAQAQDPMWREVNSLIDAIYSRLPGYSKTLNPMTNVWGQDILLEGGVGPDIMSPYYKFGQKDRPIDDWLFENEINISMPRKNQWNLELTDDEYYRYKKLAGNEAKSPDTGLGLYDTLNAIIEGNHVLSGEWLTIGTNGVDGTRQIMVRKQVRFFRELARDIMKFENSELLDKIIARKIEIFNAQVPRGTNQ